MHRVKFLLFSFIFGLALLACSGNDTNNISISNHKTVPKKENNDNKEIIILDNEEPIPGAHQTSKYIALLKGKSVGVVVNQTSMINDTHLVDSLVSLGINIKTIFAPEHGFRGNADAGEHVKNGIDTKTGLPIISLYGSNKKPIKEQLDSLDIVVFDIQDVGARFYTYISTMHYVMEACAENNKEFLLLDRPNPNGHYVDGPVLELENQSFVGMHPIPVVHGLTMAELANMIVGEKWINETLQMHQVKVIAYKHQTKYSLPIKPSPNLPNDISINLYPSLCFFEATNISIGRGTYEPFQIVGYPDSSFGKYSFTPKSIDGMSKYPKHQDKTCYGYDLRKEPRLNKLSLEYLLEYNNKLERKEFYQSKNFLKKLYGKSNIIELLDKKATEEEIRKSWEPELSNYKTLRKKYLLYEE